MRVGTAVDPIALDPAAFQVDHQPGAMEKALPVRLPVYLFYLLLAYSSTSLSALLPARTHDGASGPDFAGGRYHRWREPAACSANTIRLSIDSKNATTRRTMNSPTAQHAAFHPASALPPRRYTRTAIALHWIIAALMAGNVALILLVDSYPEAWVRPAVNTHKSIGITVLGLALLRLLWRWSHQPPPLPAEFARSERRASHVVHLLLYAVMLLLPITGWMHDSAWKDAATHPMQLFGLIPWPRIGVIQNQAPDLKEQLHTLFGHWHIWFGYVLYALFALHVLGALKHQWFDRHKVLPRMGVGRD